MQKIEPFCRQNAIGKIMISFHFRLFIKIYCMLIFACEIRISPSLTPKNIFYAIIIITLNILLLSILIKYICCILQREIYSTYMRI